MHTTGLFCRHLSFLQLRFIGCRRSRFQLPLLRELGLELRVSRYSCTLTRCTPPNRVHFQAHLSLLITDWQFASSCFPRTVFAAAVTFSYRSVDLDLTGTFAPLRQRLRSRTTKPLRGGKDGTSAASHLARWRFVFALALSRVLRTLLTARRALQHVEPSTNTCK